MTTTTETTQSTMRLYNRSNRRLYLNTSERARFLAAANDAPDHIRAFALTLFYTGCRLSEIRALTSTSFQFDERIISVRSLKKRSQHHVRDVPVPRFLMILLKGYVSTAASANVRIWDINRITAYRWIKVLMAQAEIIGPQACPKGLRHAYGIHATATGVQLHMLQKWMGHASIRTTAIYANANGEEERNIAERMWE